MSTNGPEKGKIGQKVQKTPKTEERCRMQPKKAIQQLQLAIGRAGYNITINQKRQYGHNRIFNLYTVYDNCSKKILSSYRPHEIALALSEVFQAIHAGEDPTETINRIRAAEEAKAEAREDTTADTKTANTDKAEAL